MTPEIERLAKEAQKEGANRLGCFPATTWTDEQLAKFAALVAEEAAKVCDDLFEARGASGHIREATAARTLGKTIRQKFPMPGEQG